MGVPCEHERFKSVPPVCVNVAAATLKTERTAGIVKPKLHREAVVLENGNPRPAVGILSEAKAAAHMVGRDNPAHDTESLYGPHPPRGRARMIRKGGDLCYRSPIDL